MAARSRIKADEIPLPNNQEEAEVLLGQIGSLQRRLTENETVMNEKLAAIKSRYNKTAESFSEVIGQSFKRLHGWAEANKSSLLKGKKKSAELSTGRVSWRKTPPRVNVKNTEEAIAELKQNGLKRFVRSVEVIDKEAILADREAVADLDLISVSQRTEFVAKPHDTDIEQVAKIKG